VREGLPLGGISLDKFENVKLNRVHIFGTISYQEKKWKLNRIKSIEFSKMTFILKSKKKAPHIDAFLYKKNTMESSLPLG
jgi:hypothetical protein